MSVHERHYQFDYEFFAWRFYGDRQSFTLWVSEIAAEDYEPRTIVSMLSDFEPHRLIADYRSVHLHVTSTSSRFGAYARSLFTPADPDEDAV